MFSYRGYWILGAAILLAWPCARSLAAETAADTNVSTLTTEAPAWDPKRAFFDLRYNFWFSGPTFRALDGRDGGAGPDIKIDHTLRPGYYFGNGWKARLLINVQQNFVTESDKDYVSVNTHEESYYAPMKIGPWQMKDPAIGFGNTSVLKEEVHGLDWRLFGYYYVPITRYTKDRIGTDKDEGDGRAVLDSRLLMLDRLYPVSLEFRWLASQYLKKKPTHFAHDKYFELYNRVGYQTGSRWTPYIGHHNFIQWYRDGYREPWRTSQALALGTEYRFMKYTWIDGFLETPVRKLKDTRILVYFESRFL